MSNNSNSNNNTGSAMRYPIDMSIEEQSDYIRFQFFKYKAPFKRGGDTKITGGASAEGYYGETREGSIGEKAGSDVLMYMPQDVSTSMSSSWGGKEISPAAAGALSGYANVIAGKGKAALEQLQSGLAGLTSLPTSAGAALVRMGLSATGAQANLSQNDILGGTSGIILNPNTEVLFGGPSIRNIGFKFKMMARSKQEAQRMLQICRKFQFHAAPTMGVSNDFAGKLNQNLQLIASSNISAFFKGTELHKKKKMKESSFTEQNNFIQLPDLCLFKYMVGPDVNPYLNQYKACALTNVDVNFTPDGSYSTLIDGYPSAVELSISLVETKIIYKSEISVDPELVSN